MIYAMSDIHGCLDAFMAAVEKIDFSGSNRLVLLGDYIDGGSESGYVLRHIQDMQKEHGSEKIIALKGNHEQMILDWVYGSRNTGHSTARDCGISRHEWFNFDLSHNFRTLRSIFSSRSMAKLKVLAQTATVGDLSEVAARLIWDESGEMIGWLRKLPLYCETSDYVFVHAGIDEDARELWKTGTPDWMFLEKYPPTKGKFYKTVIAGHVGTSSEYLANDPDFHGIYYDGESHYYIDGSTVISGKAPILCLDRDTLQ